MSHGYNEDQLVEQPAVQLFAELGWQTVSASDEVFGAGGTLGRETKSETVLVPRLRKALEKLNPALPPEAITVAVDELARDRSAMSLVVANREVYALLKDGVKVSVPDREHGGQKIARVRVVDWENPAANDFLLVSQMSITGTLYTRRPDLVGFIDGLPMVVVEFKKPGVPARAAFEDNLTCYEADIPQLFWSNALLMASNGTESRVGSLTADWERFFEWKRIEREDEPRRISLEVVIRGTCEPGRLLDLIENFTLFSEHKAGLVKILGQNHQFLGVNNAIAAMLTARQQGHGRGGVFWQTALRMHDKVRAHWQAERADVERQLAAAFKVQERTPELLDQIQALNAKLDAMRTTDMALIVSPGQNEIEQMRKLGLDIAPHRKRMNDEALDEKFKDSNDPLRLVFVCAMWLTGFDAPSCSTVYLDKPMRNHTLMQTIARANRVFPGKHSGLIVDYANVFASLEKALAIYGAGKGGAMPVRDKAQLVADLRKAVEDAVAFCTGHGVSIANIEQAAPSSMERLNLLAAAVEALISPDPLRKELLGHERLVTTLYNAVKPDPSVVEFASRAACLATIAGTIRERLGEDAPDISAVMAGINRLLDDSIAADGFHIRPLVAEGEGRGVIDISAIDFDALAKRFKKSKCKNLELEQLKAAIRAQLEKLIRLNKTRADYLTKFEELIESYNAGSRSIEELFNDLLALTRALSDEQQRHVRENLTEEELTVFDLLTRPGPELSPEERDEVKKVAKLLLDRLKAVLVLDWRRRNDARAKVRLAIEDALDEGLPRAYTPDVFQQKCVTLFEHVFESSGAVGGTRAREAA